MTPSHSSDSEAIDTILKTLLGDFHKHKCGCCDGVGCINCRQTGCDQTPCKVCDKDGLAFKNRDEAKAAIQQLITDARVEELYVVGNNIYPFGPNEDEPISIWLNKRIAELQPSPKHEEG